MDIKQGSRSKTKFIKFNGLDAICKTYKFEKNLTSNGAQREICFYNEYQDLEVLPNLLDTDEQTYVVLSFKPGTRHIDLVNEGISGAHNYTISYNYGSSIAQFFNHSIRNKLVNAIGTTEIVNELVKKVRMAIEVDRRYFIPELLNCLDKMEKLNFGMDVWDEPMLGKWDWSSANLLIENLAISSIYDFDSCYEGTKLTFLGNIINSCLHLDWKSVRKGLEDRSIVMPSSKYIEVVAHFSMWQKALNSFHEGHFNWPTPQKLVQKLHELSAKSKL